MTTIEIDVEVEYKHYFQRGVHTLRNGDPGWPDEEDMEVTVSFVDEIGKRHDLYDILENEEHERLVESLSPDIMDNIRSLEKDDEAARYEDEMMDKRVEKQP